jgi:hypothetical protein
MNVDPNTEQRTPSDRKFQKRPIIMASTRPPIFLKKYFCYLTANLDTIIKLLVFIHLGSVNVKRIQ